MLLIVACVQGMANLTRKKEPRAVRGSEYVQYKTDSDQ